jgi:hypothetical protein
MKTTRNCVAAISGLMLLAAVFVSSASAQSQRTFVSGVGSDANPCSRVAPCRTFTQAISQTNAGGEIYALDSAGYGPFAISKSVAIVAPLGVTAGISVFSGDGIDVNVGPADKVILRGLTINSQGTGGNGVLFSNAGPAGGVLHVENCVVNGFNKVESAGIAFLGAGHLFVKDTVVRGNWAGIQMSGPVQGQATASIDRVRMEDNTRGLSVSDGAQASVRESVASGNDSGIVGIASGGVAELNVESCLIAGNNIGANASGTLAIVRISNCTVTDNTFGLAVGPGGFILSRGNNTVEGNGTNTQGGIGTYNPK